MLVLGVLGVALSWWSSEGGRNGARRHGRQGGGAGAESIAQHGVAARINDPAPLRVFGRVVDEDDEPLEGGQIILFCLDDDQVVSIPSGTRSLDESGAFEGPGCAGTVCAEL